MVIVAKDKFFVLSFEIEIVLGSCWVQYGQHVTLHVWTGLV